MRILKKELFNQEKLLRVIDLGGELTVSAEEATQESYLLLLDQIDRVEKNERTYTDGASRSNHDEKLFQLFKKNRLASRRIKEILKELAENIKNYIDNSPQSVILVAPQSA